MSRRSSSVNKRSLTQALRKLFSELSPARRRRLLPLVLLMVIGAVAEVATLGALLPFLGVMADPQGSGATEVLAPLLKLFGAVRPSEVVRVLTALFAVAAIVSGALRLALLWAGNAYANGMAYELAVKLYHNVLHEPYEYHTKRNSSEAIATVNKVEILTWSVLVPLINGAVSLVISLFIIAGLLIIDPIVATSAGIGFGIIYLIVTLTTRGPLVRNGRTIAAVQGQRIKTMQEGLGGIRDVILDQAQPVFIEAYDSSVAALRDARTRNAFFTGAPRFLVEALGMVMIAVLATVVVGREGGLAQALPVLGALALGAQRLLPLIQQVYNGWASTLGNQQVVLDLETLFEESPARETIATQLNLEFRDAIELVNVRFDYGSTERPTLDAVDLRIPKGSRVGISGESGSGKSTLMDILLGLVKPNAGAVLIDGVPLGRENLAAWRRIVGHVPQAIYLADRSIKENIAFGVRSKDVDRARVKEAARQAGILEFIEGLHKGFETPIGERGVRLSGGQRQRLGIARALYKQARVLILDEATSALDSRTEASIMTSLDQLGRNVTVILIAHRLSTLEKCDLRIEVRGGKVLAFPKGPAVENSK